MRAQAITTFVLLTAIVAIGLAETPLAQETAAGANGTIYFSSEKIPPAQTDLVCGEQPRYNTTTTPPVTPTKAYLGRAAATLLSCNANWNFVATNAFNVSGPVVVTFPIGCNLIGAIQGAPLPGLKSVRVELLRNGTTPGSTTSLGSAEWTSTTVLCGTATAPLTSATLGQVTAQITIPNGKTLFQPGSLLQIRIRPYAVNTDPSLLSYWYLLTGANANVTAPGLNMPPGAPPSETTTPAPTTPAPTTPGPTSPGPTSPAPPSPTPTSGANGAPSCTRDDPRQENIGRQRGRDFTLRAVCTDPENQLANVDWRVDNQLVEREPLGDSPATTDRTFNFPSDGTHRIEAVPRDQSGLQGGPASWYVTISAGGTVTSTPPPSSTALIPFFDSSASVALGVLGALGGALIVLRRRST